MIEQRIWLFVIVGFLAQIIDGSLGMAYGVSSNAFLLTLGISPVIASASVHTAEVFTTLASGLSHLRMGNVDKELFKKLVIPGVLGGVLGAYILKSAPGNVIRPFVSAYLLIVGLVILYKVFSRKHQERKVRTFLRPLAVIGGFFDAIGGGGWGPIVTSTIIVRGHSPRFTIGSVNLAEFFVAFAQVITFAAILRSLVHWQVITGLLIGGVLAAPAAAYFSQKVPARVLMSLVGVLIIVLSIRTLYIAL